MPSTRMIIALVAGLAAVGCIHFKYKEKARFAIGEEEKPAEVAAPAPQPVPEIAAEEPEAGMPVEAAACSSDDACDAHELCIDSRCTKPSAAFSACQPTAHFDFDKSDLHETDEALLRRAARCLTSDASMKAKIEGHCDERGSRAYNHKLGERRADAVKTYLEGLGVSSEQLTAISYGEDKPLCTEHEESCWWQNRRAAVVPEGAPRAEPTAMR